MIKLRELIIGEDSIKLNISILVGFVFPFIILFILFQVLLQYSQISAVDIKSISKNILPILTPIVIICSQFIIFKFIKNNNIYILSTLSGLLSTVVIGLSNFIFYNQSVDLWFLSTQIISISGLTFSWILLAQSKNKISKIVGDGLFVYFALIGIVNLIHGLIQLSWFSVVQFIVYIALIGLIVRVNSYVTKRTLMLLKLEKKYEC